MPFFSHDGADIFYTVDGDGSPAVLLHGWSCDSHDWSWQLPDLAARFRVIALDHRGHGRSSAPPGDYSPQQMARDAAALLQHEAPGQRAVVMGHSMGTAVASAFAVQNPDLVRGLILVEPAYGIADEVIEPMLQLVNAPGLAQTAANLFATTFYTEQTPEFLKTWHRRRVLGTPEHVMLGSITGLLAGEQAIGRASFARNYLQNRVAPRLAVFAHADATGFERELPLGEHDEIQVIEAGHFLHQQEAEQFNKLILGWLERLPA